MLVWFNDELAWQKLLISAMTLAIVQSEGMFNVQPMLAHSRYYSSVSSLSKVHGHL